MHAQLLRLFVTNCSALSDTAASAMHQWAQLHPGRICARFCYSALVGGLPFVARVALLACIGGLAFVVCVFGGFLP